MLMLHEGVRWSLAPFSQAGVKDQPLSSPSCGGDSVTGKSRVGLSVRSVSTIELFPMMENTCPFRFMNQLDGDS